MYESQFDKMIKTQLSFFLENVEDEFAEPTAEDRIRGIAEYLKVNGFLPHTFDIRTAIVRENITKSYFMEIKTPDPDSTAMYVIRSFDDGRNEIIDKKTKERTELLQNDGELYSAVSDYIRDRNASNGLPNTFPGGSESALPGMNGEIEPKELAALPT